jgi:hypothetical protein
MLGAYHWRFAISDAADTCRQNSGHVLVSAVGQKGSKEDTKWDIIFCLLTARRDTSGHQSGHHFGQEGHQWT